ncbi:hypothetical protein [Companilactobacillus sp. HBUAS59699]|uniref:hypothetical protein n=1 Tax=Companilactobacillus sp. HBUAS59699 TaxID=3109358 RepID=UPI002FF26CA5
MTKSIDSQEVEEQSYQVGLINSLIDIAQDSVNDLGESLIKYNKHDITSNELIGDIEYFLPKIDTLLSVAFEKSEVTKNQLYKLVLADIHTDIHKKDGD